MDNLDKNFSWVPSVLEQFKISSSNIVSLKLIRTGFENKVIRISLKDGIIILREHLKCSAFEVAFECSILEKIAGKCDGFLTPKLQYTIDGKPFLHKNNKIFTVYDYIKGSHPASSNLQLINDLCDFALKLQEITSLYDWGNHLKQPNIFKIQDLTLNFINDYYKVLTIKEIELLQRELDYLVNYQKILSKFPKVVIHGDLHAGNLLVDIFGKLNAILDFDDASFEASVIEFAGIVREHCFDDDYYFSFKKCENIYFKSKIYVKKQCSFTEFIKIVKLICLRYMLYMYDANKKNINSRSSGKRLLNHWSDFQKWKCLNRYIY